MQRKLQEELSQVRIEFDVQYGIQQSTDGAATAGTGTADADAGGAAAVVKTFAMVSPVATNNNKMSDQHPRLAPRVILGELN